MSEIVIEKKLSAEEEREKQEHEAYRQVIASEIEYERKKQRFFEEKLLRVEVMNRELRGEAGRNHLDDSCLCLVM